MKIPATLTDPPKEERPVSRYSFLAIVCLLVSWNVSVRFAPPVDYKGDRNLNVNLAIAVMLLFNHVAFSFRWSRGTTAILRLAAICGSVLGCGYVVWALGMR